MDDVEFIKKSLSSILVLLVGATRGNAREEARAALISLNADEAFLSNLTKDARKRIAKASLRSPKQ
jgi:hypothetical protein